MFRAVVGQVLMTGIEIIMMIRVFALFNRSSRIRKLLISVFSVSFILEMIGTIMIICTVHFPSEEYHRSDASPMSLAFFGAGIGISQSVIAVMTSGKYIAALQHGWARTPLVSLMIRDGGLVFTLLAMFLSIIVFYEVSGELSPALWHAAYAWYIALISTAGCRLIINMRSLVLSVSERRQAVETILTTEIIDDVVDL
ncbi:hypothetical protein BD779DRAFT_1677626 [Infundibulicybe gibba]|nr:hypothetical protein BD779DRAFT_1677626 [Infundibulicybe gibba]